MLKLQRASRDDLVACGYVSRETARGMSAYRLAAAEDIVVDTRRHALRFRNVSVYCAACRDRVSQIVGEQSKPFAASDFCLQLKGPLDANSKHIVKCPDCGSRMQVTADIVDSSNGPAPLVTVHHTTRKSRGPALELPRLNATIELEESPGRPVGELSSSEKHTSSQASRRRWWEFWRP